MPGCVDCQPTNLIPTCTTALVLGTIPDLTTAVFIYVRNLTTGNTHRQSVTSDGAGLVTMDTTDPVPSFYSPNMTYEVWITLATGDLEDRLDITVGTVTITGDDACLNLNFEIIANASNDPITYATQNVEFA